MRAFPLSASGEGVFHSQDYSPARLRLQEQVPTLISRGSSYPTQVLSTIFRWIGSSSLGLRAAALVLYPSSDLPRTLISPTIVPKTKELCKITIYKIRGSVRRSLGGTSGVGMLIFVWIPHSGNLRPLLLKQRSRDHRTWAVQATNSSVIGIGCSLS